MTAKNLAQLKCLKELKKLQHILQMKDPFLRFLSQPWNTTAEVILAMILEWSLDEKGLTNQSLLTTLSAYSLTLYTDFIEYNIFGDTTAPLLCCFLSSSKLVARDIITTGQYMN